jgi:hypothetical protein
VSKIKWQIKIDFGRRGETMRCTAKVKFLKKGRHLAYEVIDNKLTGLFLTPGKAKEVFAARNRVFVQGNPF